MQFNACLSSTNEFTYTTKDSCMNRVFLWHTHSHRSFKLTSRHDIVIIFRDRSTE